ncbi:MAG TPA: RDD family protein [Terriglobales bacterium]|nr:RDD family protein [Terriglobales bacterium]
MDSLDKLTIDTPEQIAIEFPLAGIGSRFLAIVFDGLVQFIGYLVLALIAALAFGGELKRIWPSAWNWSAAIFILVVFCLYWGYYAFFETIWQGQTPGKRHAGIRVIKDTGRSITAFEAIARNLMRVVDQFPGIYAVGCVTMFLNRKSKRLGDFVAGTVVVHEKEAEAAEPFFNLQQGAQLPVYPVSKLSNTELVLIETFLARRLDLAPEVRTATAKRIAGHIAQKLELEAQPQSDNEDFLEAVAKEYRDSIRYR